MAELTGGRMGELVRACFAALAELPEGLPAWRVLQAVAQQVPPTPFEQTPYPSRPSVRRFENVVRFATIDAVKAGWLVKDKAAGP